MGMSSAIPSVAKRMLYPVRGAVEWIRRDSFGCSAPNFRRNCLICSRALVVSVWLYWLGIPSIGREAKWRTKCLLIIFLDVFSLLYSNKLENNRVLGAYYARVGKDRYGVFDYIKPSTF